jgi:hypothetical protein
MQRFLSEQVYAIRHYNDTHRPRARVVRLGFSWQPFNRLGMLPEFYVAALNEITARLASSIHWAFPPGVAHPRGACGPGGARNWCRGAYVSDAAFTDAWANFNEWPAGDPRDAATAPSRAEHRLGAGRVAQNAY